MITEHAIYLVIDSIVLVLKKKYVNQLREWTKLKG